MIKICKYMGWTWNELMATPSWVKEIILEVAKDEADAREEGRDD